MISTPIDTHPERNVIRLELRQRQSCCVTSREDDWRDLASTS
jgi:hypothetical protein